jgi:hypothetical protein
MEPMVCGVNESLRHTMPTAFGEYVDGGDKAKGSVVVELLPDNDVADVPVSDPLFRNEDGVSAPAVDMRRRAVDQHGSHMSRDQVELLRVVLVEPNDLDGLRSGA